MSVPVIVSVPTEPVVDETKTEMCRVREQLFELNMLITEQLLSEVKGVIKQFGVIEQSGVIERFATRYNWLTHELSLVKKYLGRIRFERMYLQTEFQDEIRAVINECYKFLERVCDVSKLVTNDDIQDMRVKVCLTKRSLMDWILMIPYIRDTLVDMLVSLETSHET